MLVKQTTLNFKKKGWPKAGPGRPRNPRGRVLHRSREAINRNHPIHVTLRVKQGIPKLRTGRFIRAFRQTLAACSNRSGFRVVHYSVQHNHVHCLVEASDAEALGNGMKSFASRFAFAVNRVFARKGPVLDGRYHMRSIRTPKEARNALAYVLLNARKHYRERNGKLPSARIDPLSSGHWFDGWKDTESDPPEEAREVAHPRTWLLNVGWRRHRLIRLAEVPGAVG